MTAPGALEREFINRFQGGFPLTGRPFSQVAESLGTREAILIQTVESLLQQGLLSRFGPLINAERLGGEVTLAAMAVPAQRYETVTARVNALSGVAHNYRREHRLNTWFVVATDRPEGVTETLGRIERLTDLRVYDFPKEHEFYLGLWIRLNEDGSLDTIPVPAVVHSPARPLDELDRRIIEATQAGLPLTPEPCETLAHDLRVDAWEVVERLAGMLETGMIRRVGAVPNHYRLGLRGNGMTVWDLPDDKVDELGRLVGGLDFVSHCDRRPRHRDVWPYNLFTMIHGHDREQVLARVEELIQSCGLGEVAHQVLFSRRRFKQRGARYGSAEAKADTCSREAGAS